MLTCLDARSTRMERAPSVVSELFGVVVVGAMEGPFPVDWCVCDIAGTGD